jgi:hypothetical protein
MDFSNLQENNVLLQQIKKSMKKVNIENIEVKICVR